MYDNKRIASGVGLLLTLWAVVGLVILTSGVGMAAQLTTTGGFNLSADYLGASNQSATPTTTSNGAPAFEFRVRETRADNLYLNKTLQAGTLPGVTGRFKISLNGGTAYISDTRFKSNNITADEATVRGLLIDDRYSAPGKSGPIEDKFLLYAGPAPFSQRSTKDNVMSIGRSDPGAVNRSERAALQLDGNVEIKAASLTARQIRIRNGVELRVLYDPDDDGVYEYGN